MFQTLTLAVLGLDWGINGQVRIQRLSPVPSTRPGLPFQPSCSWAQGMCPILADCQRNSPRSRYKKSGAGNSGSSSRPRWCGARASWQGFSASLGKLEASPLMDGSKAGILASTVSPKPGPSGRKMGLRIVSGISVPESPTFRIRLGRRRAESSTPCLAADDLESCSTWRRHRDIALRFPVSPLASTLPPARQHWYWERPAADKNASKKAKAAASDAGGKTGEYSRRRNILRHQRQSHKFIAPAARRPDERG